MKKRIFTNVILFVMIALMTVPTVFAASKQQQSYGNSTIYVHDLGDYLNESEELDLLGQFGKMCEKISYNVLFLTTDDTDGKSTMAYADDYIDEMFPDYEHNIAFIIDMDNREIYINTTGNAILCLTDGMIENALDTGYEYIVNYKYAECLTAMASYCIPRLSDNPPTNGVIDDNNDGYGDNTQTTGEILANGAVTGLIPGAIVTGLLCFSLVATHNKANKVQSASAYMGRDNYSVLNRNEVFVRSYEQVHRDYYRPKSSSSGGHSGGGSSHRSSSGRSHGGGGRKF